MNREDLVRDFVKSIDEDFEISFEDTFEVDIFDEHIFATFDKDEELDKMFLDFLQKEFGVQINMFMISLLHEIGHIMTYDDELDDDRTLTYGVLKCLYEEGKSSVEKYNDMYFRIPAEYEATAWGVQYYLENKEKCDKLIERVGV